MNLTYEIRKTTSVSAVSPARFGQTSSRLCSKGRYPLIAPIICETVTGFTALTAGFRMVLTASVYR